MVLPFAIIKGTRGYLERVIHQINGAYENGWYDACAVMMRRLIETMIIEVFEKYNISNKIKNTTTGDFFYLSDLIANALSESSWNFSRNTKYALPRLKDLGDKSAHSRRYNAHREDIDKVQSDFRVVVQELVYLSGMK
jgi:hypothetical protein